MDMKTANLMICMGLTAIGLLSSCTQDNSNNPDYLSANVSNINWSANCVYAGSDSCSGYTFIEADNDDGSFVLS